MKSLKEVLAENAPSFFRFKVFVQDESNNKEIVGAAYLVEGQSIYTVRLWTFLEDKFFLLMSKDDPTKYILMTREPSKSDVSKNKYHWKIVGKAKANAAQGVIEMNFDLFDKKIYMSIYPDEQGAEKISFSEAA